MRSEQISEHANRALQHTRFLIERYGARLAGTDACRQAAEELYSELDRTCGNAALETFETHPGAFMGFYQINAAVYLVSVALAWLDQPLLSGLGFLFILVSGYLQFGFYREFFDPLFQRKTCTNLHARLDPQGAAQQQIIVSGHHDSAQELRFLRRSQKWYPVKILAPDLFHATGLVFTWYWFFLRLFTGQDPIQTLYVKVFLLIGLVAVGYKFFVASPEGTPGAGDNLIASTMLVELARMFAVPGAPGKSCLDGTRLIFISFDAEESGLRGSRAYVKRHQPELQALPTYMLNIDSIYQVGELQLLTSDLNDWVKLSPQLVDECSQAAAAAGYPVRRTRMVFGGGATDAAEFAKIGVEATTLIGMPTNLIREGLVYHTMNDTADAIEPEAVEACLRIAYNLVCLKDHKLPEQLHASVE